MQDSSSLYKSMPRIFSKKEKKSRNRNPCRNKEYRKNKQYNLINQKMPMGGLYHYLYGIYLDL